MADPGAHIRNTVRTKISPDNRLHTQSRVCLPNQNVTRDDGASRLHHDAVSGKGPETVTVPICARAGPGPGDRDAGANSLNSIPFEGRQIPSRPLVISDLDMSRTAWRRLVPTRAME
jgi:hypothetical protein